MQQTSPKRLEEEGDPPGIAQEIEICPYEQNSIYTKPDSILENKMQDPILDFKIQIDHLILARQPGPCNSQQKKKKKRKKREPADNPAGLRNKNWKKKKQQKNKNKRRDKYLDLARELKKLWDMKVAVIPIVIGALGTIP